MMVFIVEDNENAREALAGYLRLADYEVAEFGEIAPARKALASNPPDLIILDVMLPDGDGFLFAKQIRGERDTAILFLTAKDQESDRITGLELGADDYVVKPFSPREVVLRVNAILKRSTKKPPPTLRLGEATLQVDTDAHRVLLNGRDTQLTPAEWTILTHLTAHSGQVFSRMQLLEACLGSIAEGSERTVDTHVKNLRRKLGNEGWIETVRGFGYRFGGSGS